MRPTLLTSLNLLVFLLACISTLSPSFAANKVTIEEARAAAAKRFQQLEIRSGNEVWAGNPTEMVLVGRLETWPAESPLYHWGDHASAKRWASQGTIDAGELDYLLNHFEGQAAGGGFYVSTDPFQTSNYGPALTVSRPASELKILDIRAPGTARMNGPEYYALSKLLDRHGISGIRYRNEWYNLTSVQALSRLRAGTLAEVAKDPTFAAGKWTVNHFLTLDGSSPLEPIPELRSRYPAIARLIAGEPLNADDLKSFKSQVKTLIWSENLGEKKGPFREKLLAVLRDEIRAQIKTTLRNYLGPSNEVAPFARSDFEIFLRIVASHGYTPEEFFPNTRFSTPIEGPNRLPPAATQAGPFGDNLIRSLEFVDYNDLLVEMAKGSATPWQRYDEAHHPPLLDRWNRAVESGGNLLGMHRILTEGTGNGDSGRYRGTTVVAGGDIIVNGKGYYPISAHQKAVLESNPYLTAEIIPDPGKPGNFLARHEYPSAKTYPRFEKLLSPELRDALKLADNHGELKNPSGQKFAELTRKIIEELVRQTLQPAAESVTALLTYQRLIAIHPFTDYNGRTLRAYYKKQNPRYLLFLRNWDMDLLMTYEELAAEAAIGSSQYNAIVQALSKEYAQNPHFPRFYDVPELWQVAANLSEAPQDSVSFVGRLKQWYKDPNHTELIRQKRHAEAFEALHRNCSLKSAKNLLMR